MAEIPLSLAEKTFILHGIDVSNKFKVNNCNIFQIQCHHLELVFKYLNSLMFKFH